MDVEGPLTSHSDPGRRKRYLLSQKRRERASCTSCTAAPRPSAGGSAQPPRRPRTKLWNAWVPSSSPSVRLRRFSDCSPALYTERGQVNSSRGQPPISIPRVGGSCSQLGRHSLTRARSCSTPSRMSSWWPRAHTVRASRLRGKSWSRYLPGSSQSSKQ